MKPYIGEDGKLVKFDADTTVSAGNESYKMWVDESTIPEGYQLQYSTGEGVEFNDRKVAGGDYQLGPNRLINYRVLLMKKQDEAKMHKEATPTTPQIFSTDPGQGAVRGKVSWDYESAGGVQWGIVSTPTSPAEGVTVTASYLSDYALKQIYSDKTANMLGVSKPSDIRGSGWTFKLETQLQEWIAKQVAADKERWIAETVSAVTNAEGDYKIQFKGTWGPKRNTSKVAEYTREAGKYYADDAHKWTEEEANRLGTVAENAEDGSFLTGALDWNEKHVNSDWLFISTKGTDDVVLRTPWNYNWYTGSDNGWGIHGGWAQAAFGVSTVQAANSTRADFNLAPAEIKFNITNFDTQANTATPGDVAKTNTAGLPYKNTNDSFKIVWYDQDGNKVKEEPTQNPTSTGALKEATFDTSSVKETKTFIAKLHYVDSKGKLGQVLAQDAFTVKVNDKIGSRYDEVEFSNGETENATYKASGLPDGLTIDESTGKVTGKPTEAGKFTVTTTITVPADDKEAEDVSADKTDEYIITDSPLKDGNKDEEYKATIIPTPIEGYEFDNVTAKFIDGKAIDGLTIAGDKISGTPTTKVVATEEDPNVEVTYDIYKLNDKGEKVLIKKGHVDKVPLSIKDGEATKYEPAYTAVDGKVGEEATVAAPTFTDKEGKPATPENVTYELGEGAPQGATVDEKTGVVTYTPVEADAGQTVNVPVVVKYSDGTTDEVKAPIKVAAKTADNLTPSYADKDGKAGEAVTTDAPTYKDADGKDATAPEGTKYKLGENAPEGATIDENTGKVTYTPKESEAGNPVEIPVVVTYPDKSTDNATSKINVAKLDDIIDRTGDEDKPTPEGYVRVTFTNGEGVNEIANKKVYDVKEGTALTADKYPEVTAKDGYENPIWSTPAGTAITKDNATITATATATTPADKDADKYDPEVSKEEVEKGGKVDLTDNVTNLDKLPEGTTVKDVTPEGTIDTNVPGDYTGKVEVTYPDGSKETVDVPVTVKDTTAPEKDADKYQPEVAKEEVEKGGKVDLTDNVTNLDKLPEGTTVKDVTPEGTIDTNVPGDYTGKVEVTYPDGSKETVDVPVTVKDTTASEDKTKITEDVKPVKPTDEKQETGIKVENKDDDTKISAKDEDGKDIPVEIDENGNVVVTPGTDVDGPITVTIEDPDLPGGKKEIEVPVEGHEKGKDDNKPSDKTIADRVNPTVPGKTKVEDPSNLTKEEKDKVKEAIEKANKDKFPQGTKVEIGKDGSATITYPDGSKDTIKGSDLVEKIADAPTRPSKQDKPSKNLPKAGIESEAMMMAAAALSTLGGLYVSKKKKEDEE